MRVIGNPFGEFRGKLAGTVFSRNKSGAIARQYVIPVDPKTDAQMASRAAFRVASQGWSSLVQITQQTWNLFADAIYNPLRGVNQGQYTGNQSYVAIRTSVNNANPKTKATTWSATGPIGPPVQVTESFVAPVNAPLHSVIPDIAQNNGGPATYVIDTASLTDAGVCEIKHALQNIVPAGLDADSFIDSSGTLYTFTVYASDPVVEIGNRPKNDFFIRLGNAELGPFAESTLDTATDFTFEFDMSADIPNFKSWFQTGQVTKLTVVAVGENGTQAIVGAKFVVIT